MNIFTMLVVLVVWLPFGAKAVPALFVVTVLMGVGTGSFVPLGGKSSPVQSSQVTIFSSCPVYTMKRGYPAYLSTGLSAMQSTLDFTWLTDTPLCLFYSAMRQGSVFLQDNWHLAWFRIHVFQLCNTSGKPRPRGHTLETRLQGPRGIPCRSVGPRSCLHV